MNTGHVGIAQMACMMMSQISSCRYSTYIRTTLMSAPRPSQPIKPAHQYTGFLRPRGDFVLLGDSHEQLFEYGTEILAYST